MKQEIPTIGAAKAVIARSGVEDHGGVRRRRGEQAIEPIGVESRDNRASAICEQVLVCHGDVAIDDEASLDKNECLPGESSRGVVVGNGQSGALKSVVVDRRVKIGKSGRPINRAGEIADADLLGLSAHKSGDPRGDQNDDQGRDGGASRA